jgi:hypothetical protein
MGPMRVVVVDVDAEDMLEVPPTPDEDPVEALAPDRPNAALGVGVHSPSLTLPQRRPRTVRLILKVKAVVGLLGAAAQGRGTDCEYAKGICVAPMRPPGDVSPAAPKRREGLFNVEVDAEEQERPKDDGQQR